MAAIVEDILKININLVGISIPVDKEIISAFSNTVGTDVLWMGREIQSDLNPKASAAGQGLVLQRDRVSIMTLPDRIIVEREYPSESDLQRLAEIADAVLLHREGDTFPAAFGYNLDLVYRQESEFSAYQYIGERLFRKDVLTPEDWVLEGGSGRLIFGSSVGRWTIQIEPRFNQDSESRLFIDLNLHKQEQRVPDSNEMLRDFHCIWSQSHSFIDHLDGKVVS